MFNLVEELKVMSPFDGREAKNVREILEFINNSNTTEDIFDENNSAYIACNLFVLDRYGRILLKKK